MRMAPFILVWVFICSPAQFDQQDVGPPSVGGEQCCEQGAETVVATRAQPAGEAEERVEFTDVRHLPNAALHEFLLTGRLKSFNAAMQQLMQGGNVHILLNALEHADNQVCLLAWLPDPHWCLHAAICMHAACTTMACLNAAYRT